VRALVNERQRAPGAAPARVHRRGPHARSRPPSGTRSCPTACQSVARSRRECSARPGCPGFTQLGPSTSRPADGSVANAVGRQCCTLRTARSHPECVRRVIRARATCGSASAGRRGPSAGGDRAADGIRPSDRSGWVRRDRAVQRPARIIWTVHGQAVEDTAGVESCEESQRTARLADCLGTDPAGGFSPSGDRYWMRGARASGR
jgi:hypothetical protein